MTGIAGPEQQNVGEIDRRTYLGGSDAAAILKVGATYDGVQQTPYTVYLKKIGELSGTMDPEKKKFLERRKRWEEPIVAMLREEFKGEIVAINCRYVDPEYDFIAAEIDFEWRDSNGNIQNGEIKTVSPFAFGERHGWGEAGTGDIPVHYAAQVMHGLMVKNRQICIVAAMVGIDNMIFYRIDRDEETIANLRAAEVHFWNEHVLKKIPPDPQSLSDVTQQMLKKPGRPVAVNDEIMGKLSRLATVNADLTRLAEEKEYLAFDVGDFICKAWDQPNPYTPPSGTVIKRKGVKVDPLSDAGIYYQGVRVASWNKQRGSYLDQNRLKAEHPEIAAELAVDHFFRVLRHHNPK